MKKLPTFDEYVNESQLNEESYSDRSMLIPGDQKDEILSLLKKHGLRPKISTDSQEYGGDYDLEFRNSKEAEKAEQILADFFTESSDVNESKAPKSWNTMFAINVLKAWKNGEIQVDAPKQIAAWEKDYNGGVAPRPAFETEAIIRYYQQTGKGPDGKIY